MPRSTVAAVAGQEAHPVGVRVRYPPSPTGFQHIGSVRTALYNYLYSRRTGGKFILRIEDTDRKRFVPEALQDIYDTFAWLGFHWDEGPDLGGPHGPYFQSERMATTEARRGPACARAWRTAAICTAERLESCARNRRRQRAANQATSRLQGYDRHCRNLSEQELRAAEASGLPSVIRLKVPLEGSTTYTDLLLGEITVENKVISPDPVLIKSDGFPTYHMANRRGRSPHGGHPHHARPGMASLGAGARHSLPCASAGSLPCICHLPMVMGKDGHKLSKRLGSTSVRDFRAQGYLPDALLNCIAHGGLVLRRLTRALHASRTSRSFSTSPSSTSLPVSSTTRSWNGSTACTSAPRAAPSSPS